jgi:succinylglutamic semialdehyde dehydrogenase
MMKIKGDYFNGAFQKATQKDECIEKFCPADTEQKLWEACVDYTNIEKVVESAQNGFKQWKILSFEERAFYLKKYKEALLKRQDDISEALSLEIGKPLWEAKTEASALLGKVDVTLNDSLSRIQTQTFENIMPEITGLSYHKPIGTTLIIGPFNFPCHLPNGQILSSLLAGNSIIFKPSEKTIYSSQILIECFHEAGFPEGVINFINGTVHTASELTKHPLVKGIFFTGSQPVGIKILENTYRDLSKLVALELGGRNATIIHSMVDMEHTLTELIRACYLTSGQRCSSTSIILVQKKWVDEFQAKFTELVRKIHVDHPIDFTSIPFMGPLIDAHSQKLYYDFQEMTKTENIESLVAPKILERKKKGYYNAPALHYYEHPLTSSAFFKGEIFAPQACIIPFDTIDEAITLANLSPYGLAASVFTKDQQIFNLCKQELEAGVINLNRSTVGAHSKLPFGGVKNSGNFRAAAVSMIDHCASLTSTLETMSCHSKISEIVGLSE